MEFWARQLAEYDGETIKGAIDECVRTLEWPPSIAEFIGLCDKHSGVPSIPEIIQKGIRRDFSHPLTKIVYDKIGNWDFSHLTQQELQRRISEIYAPSLAEAKQKALT